jgi:Domain of unknown function (DUF2382)
MLDMYYGITAGAASPRGDDVVPAGRAAGGGASDDAMTRAEEERRVGKGRHEAGRVRLRKYVTTEQVTKTVAVQRVRKERIEVDDPNGRAKKR